MKHVAPHIATALCGLFALSLGADAQQAAPTAQPAPNANSVVARQKSIAETGVPVEITQVRQMPVRLLGAVTNQPTQRFEVTFRTLPLQQGEQPLSSNPLWADKIKFTLTLCYRVKKTGVAARPGAPAATAPAAAAGGAAAPAAADDGFRFYRASATVLTVKRGTTYSVFFYLPGEIIERDQLPNEPMASSAEVEIGGKPGNPWYSRTLKTNKNEQDGFNEKAGRGVLDTAGILRNQNQVQGLDMRIPASPTLLAEESR